MHPDRKRTARCDRCAARSSSKTGKQRTLLLRHAWFVDQGEAWRRAFGGHDWFLGNLLGRAGAIAITIAEISICPWGLPAQAHIAWFRIAGRNRSLDDYSTTAVTFINPRSIICKALAAARERSSTRPLVKGPRSLTTTMTVRWECGSVTCKRVPNGRLRCAAVYLCGS